jgi:16S rRNA (guanine1207-N2)-methyltransferase
MSDAADTPPQHYFSPAPATASRPATVRLDLPDLSVTLGTDRGVFSAGRIDPGTKLLLLEAPAPPEEGDLLDLGCGYGPVAVTLAARAPHATVWAVDVNERALALTRANAEAAGLASVRAVLPDDVPDGVRFAAIWSNPPVRIGKAALHGLLDQWLPRLRPDGSALLVVQKHLGADSLHRWLSDRGWRVERRASRMGYRILAVDRGPDDRGPDEGRPDEAGPDEAPGGDS